MVSWFLSRAFGFSFLFPHYGFWIDRISGASDRVAVRMGMGGYPKPSRTQKAHETHLELSGNMAVE